MKKEIRKVDEKNNIIQITTVDERWYVRETTDKETGLPKHEYVPSVTWITESYPKGIAFYKWLANHGWDEAEALKTAAGDKGSKIHYAINSLLDGETINMQSKFFNESRNMDEELTIEEYEAIMSFIDWYNQAKPEILAREFCVWGDGYAGMVDLLCKLSDILYIIDIKSPQYIWPSHELQISAYKQPVIEVMKKPVNLAILQVGYRLNKRKWKFTEIDDKYNLFLAAKSIWQNEHGKESPSQRDYPLSLSLNLEKTQKVIKEKQNAKRKRPETK